ncbi:low-density lipoprotein receptor-like isoform X2 [Neoarius graeffei]|uniref:low-density lipoprotein receptor-like isoform X2 n=1 Tax=Neoarius graeffei TaxID=443677 RepID=UPI00298C3FB3|nr:low-density lipoprotein receptor-like isoform X2 [Neoarius graeffei]
MERFYTLLLLAGLLFAKSANGAESVQNQERTCLSSEFRCSDGGCVDHSWWCDHSEDCEDGSDEKNCEVNECEVNNGGCSHHCVDQPYGFVCDCPSGMRLMQDTWCEDNAAAVIFSSGDGIMWMKPDGSEQKKLTSSTGTSGALTSHTAENTVYWAHAEHTHIYRLVLDAGGQEPSVRFSEVSGVVGLAVDWINEVLYWSSNTTRAVHAAALNGTEHAPLILGLSSPTAVAVQPLAGFLFWADTGVSPRIERSGLNGQNRKPLVTSALRNPVSIALDIPRGLLYWADAHLNTVSRVTYDGLHRKTVIESNGYLDQPFGLALFESGVYWSDRLTGVICRADKHNGKLLQITRVSGASSPGGLLLLHPLLQPTVSDMTSFPAEPSSNDSDSALAQILSLIVLPCVLFAALFGCWRTGMFSSSLSQFSRKPMMESQNPLLPSGHTEAQAEKLNVPAVAV